MSRDLMIAQYLIIISQYIIYQFLIKNTIFGSRGIMFNQFMDSWFGCNFAHPYLDVTKEEKNFAFDIIILDILCDNLPHVALPLQIL